MHADAAVTAQGGLQGLMNRRHPYLQALRCGEGCFPGHGSAAGRQQQGSHSCCSPGGAAGAPPRLPQLPACVPGVLQKVRLHIKLYFLESCDGINLYRLVCPCVVGMQSAKCRIRTPYLSSRGLQCCEGF